jgi:hypothetical protein
VAPNTHAAPVGRTQRLIVKRVLRSVLATFRTTADWSYSGVPFLSVLSAGAESLSTRRSRLAKHRAATPVGVSRRGGRERDNGLPREDGLVQYCLRARMSLVDHRCAESAGRRARPGPQG